MKKRFTEEQIIGFLRGAEAGLSVKDLCRRVTACPSMTPLSSPAPIQAKSPASCNACEASCAS